uniref:Small ribosomal subunit protein uS19c n=1 Tax=Arachnitis uniflora TaxID=191246 RepID=A0A0K1H2M9_9LILI|nr:30S ribosomal protein S19 [Arachnitis uniflora]AKT73985.1 ribosomal protein S19 [Arachnitis uniflora]QKE31278.1 30S ribosomal protein S19 [Arachnitis uniflora]
MARLLKKKPFVDKNLLEKLKKKKVGETIVTWSRTSTVLPAMIGYTIAIYNGRAHLPIYIIDRMVGHKLGEFVPTFTFIRHVRNDKKSHR